MQCDIVIWYYLNNIQVYLSIYDYLYFNYDNIYILKYDSSIVQVNSSTHLDSIWVSISVLFKYHLLTCRRIIVLTTNIS
jgi:hypothetical protein